MSVNRMMAGMVSKGSEPLRSADDEAFRAGADVAARLAAKKQALRQQIREDRRLRSAAARAEAATGFATQLAALVTRSGARRVTCYLSTPTEPGTRDFLVWALQAEVEVLLPISLPDGQLEWAHWRGADSLTSGAFGIAEPIGTRIPTEALSGIDLMLIPAAAVSPSGGRLGWGKGYFDRAIAQLADLMGEAQLPPVYALVFAEEVLDQLPCEAHDAPLTGFVTPTAVRLSASLG